MFNTIEIEDILEFQQEHNGHDDKNLTQRKTWSMEKNGRFRRYFRKYGFFYLICWEGEIIGVPSSYVAGTYLLLGMYLPLYHCS